MPDGHNDYTELQLTVLKLCEQVGLEARRKQSSNFVQAAIGSLVAGRDPRRYTVAKAWRRAGHHPNDAFDPSLFNNCAWNMMLELYIMYCEGRKDSVTSLSIASLAPPTTALRHICVFDERGWILRIPDPRDGRRIHVTLTDEGIARCEQALDRVYQTNMLLGIGHLSLVK